MPIGIKIPNLLFMGGSDEKPRMETHRQRYSVGDYHNFNHPYQPGGFPQLLTIVDTAVCEI
jgi:hypothetical protein